MRRLVRAGAVLALVLTAGCVRPPGRLAGDFPPVTVFDAQTRGEVGTRVRWGGTIVRTTPEDEGTCFEVVSFPLDRAARPILADDTLGRFIACTPGFYDPAVYALEREITVVGTIEGTSTGRVGEREYAFPRVRATAVHLWPRREPAPRVIYDPWPGPYWGWPYWGWPYYAYRPFYWHRPHRHRHH